jgi:hypothetical protein
MGHYQRSMVLDASRLNRRVTTTQLLDPRRFNLGAEAMIDQRKPRPDGNLEPRLDGIPDESFQVGVVEAIDLLQSRG